MNRILLFLAMLATMTGTASAAKTKVKPKTDSVFIFAYSDNPHQGIKLAVSNDGKNSIRQMNMLSCDYGPWGAEKSVFTPYLYRENENEWFAVWSVNGTAPCFAAAHTNDLIHWQPQEYPKMSNRGCNAPIIRKSNNGEYDILFTNSDKNIRISHTSDFRHFSPDESVSAIDYHYMPDTMMIDGKTTIGQLWRVSGAFAKRLIDNQTAIDSLASLYSENLSNDTERFKGQTEVQATLHIDANSSKKISDKLIGIFFEDISYAADGGLYAEMIENRDFEYTYGEHHDDKNWNALTAWHAIGGLDIRTDTIAPIHANNPHYAVITTTAKGQGIENIGFDGLSITKGDRYILSLFARSDKPCDIHAVIAEAEKQVGEVVIKKYPKGKWSKMEVTFTATADADKASLRLIPTHKGTLDIDMVSLFPEDTYCHHRNGLKKHLAETIASLHPKFMRFPGGCMSHGDGIGNIYQWKESVGPLEARKPANNIWRYHQTRGLGFYEYFQFCEDMHCEPLPVLAAGVPCQNSQADASGMAGQQCGISMDKMPQYVQDILDLIDWANGDAATNKWAKMRADAGHPAPFGLHYIGIGNEDLISTVFEERYLMICKAIKEKHPEIQVCGTVGPFHDPSSDYAEGWRIARNNHDIIDMVDEHYYESIGWFLHNQHYYDHYDRTAPHVYLGEYAASTKVKRSNVETALAEALHLCNVERNGDIVDMTSYAPLLAKDGHNNWNPDMIYFGNSTVRVTPSYETQRLFSKYSGDEYITSALDADKTLAYRIASSVVRDSKTGAIYLKIVNMLPLPIKLSIADMQLPSSLECEGYTGSLSDQHVSVTTSITSPSAITLKPYSLQAIRLK